MAVSSTVSLALASVFSLLLFSTMQLNKNWFASSQLSIILGGYIGSWLFIFALTAVSNLESVALGRGFQAKLFPEIILCFLASVVACGTIHRVCATTCVLFSFAGLYFVNKISLNAHSVQVLADIHTKKKRK